MPELPEVESYRRLAESAVGRTVRAVCAPDPWWLKGGLTADSLAEAMAGRTLTAARRRGKLLLIDTDGGPVLGLRFGMTGRLLVDGSASIERLQHAPAQRRPEWDRLTLLFDDGDMVVSDPRRLGGAHLDPDEDRLGPDAAPATTGALRRALAGSAAPLKARIMDQARLAGVGNLAADEILWRAGLDPTRPAGGLDPTEVRRLAHHVRATLAELARRGGSHTGDLGPHRGPGGRCPRDGAALVRATVGGRTTWWCPDHQH